MELDYDLDPSIQHDPVNGFSIRPTWDSRAKMGELLEQAKIIVAGKRHEAYGRPEDNHARTADLWNAYLRNMNGRSVDSRDVCNLNILQKLSRDLHWRQRDNMLDIAGYAANGHACQES